jgi:hypothetical protein
MDKNWLIRTKNNHILGPVSKKKVRELVVNGSIKGDDEVCSGNGYWIFIREKELVDKYVLGDIGQDFNPVSEADSVLVVREAPSASNEQLPSADDLAYPGEEEERDDITQVGGINLADLKEEASGVKEMDMGVEDMSSATTGTQVNDELPEAPVMEEVTEEVTEAPVAKTPLKKKAKKSVKKQSKKPSKKAAAVPKGSLFNVNVLYFLAFFFIAIAIVAFYFRKRIIKQFIEASNQIHIIAPAHAQLKDGIIQKKK